ncbi:5-dehydro-4-deoxyglucarate dehydratase [Streptomyces boluensis]|uniref:Probable 5-dehydro-4-deoxyglucarate dehydratase n=1 Tax=Streptomyces boluensis TaxID=1775135 RepID=A0A964XPJ3_9ACTN|nr:5-dehydro-4-deoxyglucarate dehydratase [Streptomyces boluensis]NBE56635.1 5-dehydro-4-deoxyglucarate dehydratase [Streptomyces boluensis]
MTPAPLAARLRIPSGPLFFPVTAYGLDGAVDLDAYRVHLRAGIEAGGAAVFAACGTGEFHALTPEEFQACVAAAVEEAAGRVPVVAGTGYGTALAVRYATLAEQAGADGLLALPPYLVAAEQRGLVRHYSQLADATGLDVIVYQRDNALFTPDSVVELARHPRIIGLKDGHGDLGLLQGEISAVRAAGIEDFLYFNGLPTAEWTQRAYRALGVTLYSSAAFCFAPDLALACHRALHAGTPEGEATLTALLDGFYRPLVALRDSGRGYAVSLVKAGVRQRGQDVGPVRPPLTEPDAATVRALAELVEEGRELLARRSTGPEGGAA